MVPLGSPPRLGGPLGPGPYSTAVSGHLGTAGGGTRCASAGGNHMEHPWGKSVFFCFVAPRKLGRGPKQDAAPLPDMVTIQKTDGKITIFHG